MTEIATEPPADQPRMLFVTVKGYAEWPRPSLVDYIVDGRGLYGKQTLEELKAKYPDGEVLPENEAHDRYNNAFLSAPKRIDKKRFWYLLEVLPPCRWTRLHTSESFHVSERLAGDVVTWAVRIGESYFETDQLLTMKHDELTRLCMLNATA